MKASSLLAAIVLALCLVPGNLSAQIPTAAETQATIEAIRTKHDLPALSVAIFKEGTLRKAGVGVRKQGDSTLVLPKDAFHIGSCTKPMTATLAGMLIDDGKLRWDSTIAEVLPDLKGKMHGNWNHYHAEIV